MINSISLSQYSCHITDLFYRPKKFN